MPWGLGCFAGNSAQQARLGIAAPAFASALMALNSSAIYLGQAAGAGSGGWLIAHGGYAPLNWLGLGWLLLALALSVWAARRARRRCADDTPQAAAPTRAGGTCASSSWPSTASRCRVSAGSSRSRSATWSSTGNG